MSECSLSPDSAAKIAKAIANPQRFAILQMIAASDEIACKTLVAEFSITQATISHHLKELVAAELIQSRREGQLAMLRCRRDVCAAYLRMLARQLRPGFVSPAAQLSHAAAVSPSVSPDSSPNHSSSPDRY